MDGAGRQGIEDRVRDRVSSGDGAGAAEALVLGYGPEILGWLVATTGDEQEAADVFGTFCEEVVRGLPRFRGDCSARTWAYAVARNCQRRLWASPARRREIALTPSLASRLDARVRTETAPFLRTEVKDRLAELRARMAPEDRSLLVLRLDRGMAWDDIARVFGVDAREQPDALKKRAAALRKRFQRLKGEIRASARADGLIE